MRWKWSNIPIPEAHLIGLITGTILQLLLTHKLFQLSWIGYAIGFPLSIVGIGLCAWSVIEAKELNIASPNMLLEGGPYTLSRNPMYVGWTLIYIGISFAANTVWTLEILPFVLIYIHFVDISREERVLEEKFGEKYRQFKSRVRRYI